MPAASARSRRSFSSACRRPWKLVTVKTLGETSEWRRDLSTTRDPPVQEPDLFSRGAAGRGFGNLPPDGAHKHPRLHPDFRNHTRPRPWVIRIDDYPAMKKCDATARPRCHCRTLLGSSQRRPTRGGPA